ncbi:unnamed protein product [Amoebophrya sp. A120]|nr:unnamed protein product [Amoebophrya sp. A120]|eukprot:GSA120T00004618001.1
MLGTKGIKEKKRHKEQRAEGSASSPRAEGSSGGGPPRGEGSSGPYAQHYAGINRIGIDVTGTKFPKHDTSHDNAGTSVGYGTRKMNDDRYMEYHGLASPGSPMSGKKMSERQKVQRQKLDMGSCLLFDDGKALKRLEKILGRGQDGALLAPEKVLKHSDWRKNYMLRLDKATANAPNPKTTKQQQSRMEFVEGHPVVVYGEHAGFASARYKLKPASGAVVQSIAGTIDDKDQKFGGENLRQSQVTPDPCLDGVEIKRRIGVLNKTTGVYTQGGIQKGQVYIRQEDGKWVKGDLPPNAGDPSPPAHIGQGVPQDDDAAAPEDVRNSAANASANASMNNAPQSSGGANNSSGAAPAMSSYKAPDSRVPFLRRSRVSPMRVLRQDQVRRRCRNSDPPKSEEPESAESEAPKSSASSAPGSGEPSSAANASAANASANAPGSSYNLSGKKSSSADDPNSQENIPSSTSSGPMNPDPRLLRDSNLIPDPKKEEEEEKPPESALSSQGTGSYMGAADDSDDDDDDDAPNSSANKSSSGNKNNSGSQGAPVPSGANDSGGQHKASKHSGSLSGAAQSQSGFSNQSGAGNSSGNQASGANSSGKKEEGSGDPNASANKSANASGNQKSGSGGGDDDDDEDDEGSGGGDDDGSDGGDDDDDDED